ncbi:flagellar hook-associated protein FlgK [Butyrivibrio sp. MC2013]|uniref:flagellar hook-associated protein FlgK n=1 Tax=Butyrivibrio sp. MC2013 TaxID=1280686 RepID=UPI00040AA2F3|nr:flagellar hook-associated protein FlgK [Butyrivibrio sp. MC2013]
MASQFFGLNIAASGLRAANAALNTTANNVSNVNTEGYSRQQVTQEASAALRVFTTYGCAGAGVDTIAIERVRDEFYDRRYRDNETLLGQYQEKNYYSGIIEQYLEDDGTTGFSSLFTRMKASLESVMTSAGTETNKATFVSSMSSVTEYFNTLSTNLKNLQSDINSEIRTTCDDINSIAGEIATLNEQINVVEMTRTTANDLRDKRDALVDKLSEYVSVEVKESKIYPQKVVVNSEGENEVTYDEDSWTGATRYEVWIAGGQCLVDTYSYNKLHCIARGEDESRNQNDVDGLYDIKWVRSDYEEGSNIFIGDFDLYNANIGGKLKGLIEMRDGNNQEFFNGQSSFWNADTRVLTVSVSDGYLKDMARCTIPGMGVIEVGTRTYEYDSWEYDGDSTYRFTLSERNDDGTLVDTTRIKQGGGENVAIGCSINYQGIPYYMSQMNQWVRNFAGSVNSIMANGFTSDSGQGSYMLTGDRSVGSRDIAAQYTYSELTSTSYGYYFLTAENFAVYSSLVKDSGLLSTKADITEGADEFGVLKDLKEMFNNKQIFRGAASGEFLDKILADASLNKSNAKTMEDTYTSLANTIDNQRLSIMGVDEDEEAANLVKFQNAYQLSAKVVQTFSEIYDRLILETGV